MEPKAVPWIQEIVEKCGREEAKRLEMLAAAFCQETGLKASECELVQDMTEPLKVMFYFRKKRDI